MPSFLKDLIALGFSPLNCVLMGGLAVLWRVMTAKDDKQTADREAWHADTRAQVAELKGHVVACDKDRQELRMEQAKLEERLSRRCPRKDCPLS